MEQITMVRVEDLHPHEQNPRISAASVADLVESIREHGVEVPLVAAPSAGAETPYVVLAGHRRLTAAHELGLTEVPVQIRENLTDARDQLAFMATENILRDQLTAVEESRLVQDMLDLGMTQAEVAKQTALGKQRVKDRVKLGKLAEQTGEKVHRGQITVDDALVIAEYSDDPETAKELEDAAGTQNFDYYTSRAKARREARKLVAEAKRRAKKEGVRIVDGDADFVSLLELTSEQMWSTAELDELAMTDPDNDEWLQALAAAHADCPGHCIEITETGAWAGESQYGCDQVATRHDTAPGGETPTEDEPEAEPDPLDRFTPEDLRTMRIDREKKVHTALTATDLTDWALEDLTDRAVAMLGRTAGMGNSDEYRGAFLGFLGLPSDATDPQAIRALKQLPWPARYAVVTLVGAALWHHVPMASSSRAWQWRGTETNNVDELFSAVDAEPSALEKELRALHNNPWDSPIDAEAGAALAEGGEAA